MNIDAFKKSGKFILTAHAKERIRLRLGIDSVEAATAWANDNIAKSSKSWSIDNKTHYIADTFELICDGIKVITVKPVANSNSYLTKLNGVLSKEITRLLTVQNRALRKAEIEVTQLTLNYLKARNPKVKSLIQSRLTKATDEKSKIADKVKSIELAAEHYGVEV